MSQDPGIDDVVHRFSKAVVTMDIGQIMNDLLPEAMMKLQAAAGGGMAIQINDYQLLGRSRDGADYLYDIKYLGPQSFILRARWSQVGGEWKLVDGDVIAQE